jgi:hypothetical protein
VTAAGLNVVVHEHLPWADDEDPWADEEDVA